MIIRRSEWLPDFLFEDSLADIETVTIGAGVVGLAIGRALARSGQEVLVLERHGLIGSEISARNSEVIHAGLYYPKDSLKARFCVAGKHMLYAFCQERGVAHANCGKLIAATDESQHQTLENIRNAAANNGVSDLIWLSGDEARAREPELSCTAALFSPSTGIVDSHGLMLSLQGDMEDHGGALALGADLAAISRAANGEYLLTVEGKEFASYQLSCKNLIIASGLESSHLAMSLFSDAEYEPPETYYAKGNYYSLQGRAPFSHLIYPVPEPGGLGVHLTLDLAGQARFGPDVEWVEELNYDVDPARAEKFYAAIRRYWPGLHDDALTPDYAGIRPKLTQAGQPAADFTVHGAADHGLPRCVILYGIESPGLTSSLAIAEYVEQML